MKILIPLCLLMVSSIVGTATAQTAPAPEGSGCVPLAADQQLIRKGADRSMLLRSGTDHYIVHFQTSCTAAAFSKKLEFSTPNNQGQLCGARASKLRTDSGSCDVKSLEPISAEAFASRAGR